MAPGIRLISSCLKKYGHHTQLLFLQSTDRLYSKKVIEAVTSFVADSDVIGLSCLNNTSDRAKQLIKALKPLKKLIVWGGIHATLNVMECLEYANFVCVGEGEDTMLELINRIEKGENTTKIKNLYLKRGKKIIKNPLRNLIVDLDKLPFWDYSFDEKYVLNNGQIVPLTEQKFFDMQFDTAKPFLKKQARFVYVNTSRGCPHSCSFCYNSYLKKLYKYRRPFIRTRSAKNFVRELMSFKRRMPSLSHIRFSDDSFFLRSKKEDEAFSRLYKKNVGLPFICIGDPLTITPGKLRLFVDAGLNYITMGIQTGSNSLNKEFYNRNIKNAQVLRAARLINKYKERLHAEYQVISTNPYEGEKDIISTIRLLAKLPKPYKLTRANMVFFPGTFLYYKAEKDGLLKERDEFGYKLELGKFINHLRVKKLKNIYLYYITQCMGKEVTERRYGIIPKFMLKSLISKRVIKFCNNSKIVTRFLLSMPFGYSFFRALPSSWKMVYLKLSPIRISKKAEAPPLKMA